MGNLASILREDSRTVTKVLHAACKGAVRGSYTPPLMSTGISQFIRTMMDESSAAEVISTNVAQTLSACATQIPLAAFAIERGWAGEYFGALAATNAIDYFVHAYRRAREGRNRKIAAPVKPAAEPADRAVATHDTVEQYWSML